MGLRLHYKFVILLLPVRAPACNSWRKHHSSRLSQAKVLTSCKPASTANPIGWQPDNNRLRPRAANV